jgi:hypothetical protein
MILKGNQRSGGDELATHLMNAFDNEHVEVAQVRGTVADDLHGAFGEYEAHAAGTRCTEPLYSLSINPSAPISRDQYYTAIDRIEQRLGLSGQPRAVVFHVKHGREHCHVVWSRIDTAKMRAVQLSHDRQKLRSLARELGVEFGLPLPEGLQQDLRADRKLKKKMTLAEQAQARETGVTPEQRRAEITAAFRRSDSPEAFRAALKEKGYILARGDKRAFVVVDRFGKVHSLARQIDGIQTRDLNPHLEPMSASIPDVDTAKQSLAREAAETKARIDARVARRMKELSGELAARQKKRRQKIDISRQEMNTVQGGERMSLHAAHKSEARKPFARAAGAIFALFDRVPGLRSVIAPLRRNPKINPAERQRIEEEALSRRHQREQFMLERRYKALGRLESREFRSLEVSVRQQLQEVETGREQKAESRQDRLEVNKLDITVPVDSLHPVSKKLAKREGKSGWNGRREALGNRHGNRPKRPRGYGFKKDAPGA